MGPATFAGLVREPGLRLPGSGAPSSPASSIRSGRWFPWPRASGDLPVIQDDTEGPVVVRQVPQPGCFGNR